MMSAQKGTQRHIEIIARLMEEEDIKVNIRDKDKEGYTALIWASVKGNAEAVKEILANSVGRADVNAKDKSGYTSLIRASKAGHADVVKELLDAGADASICDEHGNGPFELAEAQKKKWETRAKEQREKKRIEGVEKEKIAIYSNVVKILGKNVEVNAKSRRGSTAIIEASSKGRFGIVKKLISHGSEKKTGSDGGQKTGKILKMVPPISIAASFVAVGLVTIFQINNQTKMENMALTLERTDQKTQGIGRDLASHIELNIECISQIEKRINDKTHGTSDIDCAKSLGEILGQDEVLQDDGGNRGQWRTK